MTRMVEVPPVYMVLIPKICMSKRLMRVEVPPVYMVLIP